MNQHVFLQKKKISLLQTSRDIFPPVGSLSLLFQMSFRIARGAAAAASITAAAAAAMTAAAAAAAVVFFQRALVTDRFASASAACRGYNGTTSCLIHPIANGGDEVHQTARSQETAIRDQRAVAGEKKKQRGCWMKWRRGGGKKATPAT